MARNEREEWSLDSTGADVKANVNPNFRVVRNKETERSVRQVSQKTEMRSM
jgi:hypothetical protein